MHDLLQEVCTREKEEVEAHHAKHKVLPAYEDFVWVTEEDLTRSPYQTTVDSRSNGSKEPIVFRGDGWYMYIRDPEGDRDDDPVLTHVPDQIATLETVIRNLKNLPEKP